MSSKHYPGREGEEVNVYRFACIHRFCLGLVGSSVLPGFVCVCITRCGWVNSLSVGYNLQPHYPVEWQQKATRKISPELLAQAEAKLADFHFCCHDISLLTWIILPQWCFLLRVWKIQICSCMKVLKEEARADLDATVLMNVGCVQDALGGFLQSILV